MGRGDGRQGFDRVRSRPQHPSPTAQDLKKIVVGWDEHGVRQCIAFICRLGTLPIVFFTIRTPITAGDSPTVPIEYASSTSSFQISLAVLIRSASACAKAPRNMSSAFTICGSSGLVPWLPPLA